MNFEDMQAVWREQHPANRGVPEGALDAKLLERIRRNQAGYTRTMVLAVLTQALAVAIVAALIAAELTLFAHPVPPRVLYEFRAGLGAGVALLLLMAIIVGRRAPGMYAIMAGRSELSLANRIHRDARRYWLGGVVGYGSQIVVGLVQTALAFVLSHRVGLHGPLRWVALGLVALPALMACARLRSLRSPRPGPGQSLAEVLDRSIDETKDRTRQAGQAWWQAGVMILGFLLSLQPLWLHHDASTGWAFGVMLAILILVPLSMRKWAKGQLRQWVDPRLKELESLRAGLAEGSEPEGRRD